MVQPWLKLSCSCERQGPAPHALGPTRNSPSSRAGLPPQDLTRLVEVDVKSVRCLNACFFYVFLSLRVFSLGLFLVGLTLILKML